MASRPPLRCGRISYTNDLPVYAAFDAGAVPFPGQLVEGTPAQLNAMMLRGELDCGPVSSFFAAQHPEAFILLGDVCIGSRGAVRSIYCCSHVPPRELAGAEIAMTTESATGRALFDVLCRLYFGFRPVYRESKDPLAEYLECGTPCVVIGDRAIDAWLADPSNAYDLGTLWHDRTGADMVYAVWVASRRVAAERPSDVSAVGRALRAALMWGEAHVGAVIDAAQALRPRPHGFYRDYYAALNYHFDPRAQAGLRAFFDACASTGMLERSPSLEAFSEEPQHV